MLFSKSIKREAAVLRDDATKVLDQVAEARDRIAEVGKEQGELLKDRGEELVSGLRERAQDSVGLVSAKLRGVDAAVRQRPYQFVLGAIALGLAVGIFLPMALRRD